MILFVAAVVVLLLLLIIGMPIAFSLAIVGVVGFALVRGLDAAIQATSARAPAFRKPVWHRIFTLLPMRS